MKKLQLPVLAGLLCAAMNVQALEPSPGLWNISALVKADGSSQPLAHFHHSQCLSREELKNPQALLSDSVAKSCSYSDLKHDGNRLDFKLQCDGELPMSGFGSVTYDSDLIVGEAYVIADLQGIEVATTSQVTGTRDGDCTAAKQ